MGKSSTKAKNKYNAANYDRVHISVPKGAKERWQKHAEKQGVSLTALITDLIEKDIERAK